MRRLFLTLSLVLLILSATFLTNVTEVGADTITPNDLINLINNVRTGTYGNPALVVDQILMNQAQWTAQTMADYGIHGHLADNGYPGVRTRIANAGYGGGSTVWATENWAGGSVPLDFVYQFDDLNSFDLLTKGRFTAAYITISEEYYEDEPVERPTETSTKEPAKTPGFMVPVAVGMLLLAGICRRNT